MHFQRKCANSLILTDETLVSGAKGNLIQHQQSNFFIYTTFHLVHQKWQFAVAILSGVTPFLLYHSTDIVLIEKNHLVQLKKAFLSDHNKWSYALFTLLFK